MQIKLPPYATYDMIQYALYLFELMVMMFVNVLLYIPAFASSFVVQQYPFFNFKVFVIIEGASLFLAMFMRFKEFVQWTAIINCIVLFLTGLAIPYLIVGALRLGVLVAQFFVARKVYYLISNEYYTVLLDEQEQAQTDQDDEEDSNEE